MGQYDHGATGVKVSRRGFGPMRDAFCTGREPGTAPATAPWLVEAGVFGCGGGAAATTVGGVGRGTREKGAATEAAGIGDESGGVSAPISRLATDLGTLSRTDGGGGAGPSPMRSADTLSRAVAALPSAVTLSLLDADRTLASLT
jgi:hypothetical protein